MMHQQTRFSNQDRTSRIDNIAAEHFDIVIIGGGVTGVGIALDAALRGLKTILVEKSDFASGTSSKSTKLIHGGLRYLKQLEIGLVRETGLERSIAHGNACHLVHPEHMLLPIIEGGTFSKFSASMAISVYDWLANVPKEDKKKTLSKKQVLQEEPLLKSDITKSGILYSEYRTDDARLTIELIKDARRHGAEAFNYMKVESFLYNGDTIGGVQCYDSVLDRQIDIKGEIVVNATGPWVDGLRQIDDQGSDTNLHLTKGVHIVLPNSKLPLKHSTYFDAPDGRMIFAIPRGKIVYVGTTDTTFTADKNNPTCSLEDANYLLESINRYFNIAPILLKDIESTWAGLRPLIQQKGKPPSELSRKDEIFISDKGLISIAGGKLTGYRKMAERIIDLAFKKNKKSSVPSSTKTHKITREPYNSYSEFLAHTQQLTNTYAASEVDDAYILFLVSTYGREAESILNNAHILSSDTRKDAIRKIILSQIDYTIAYESISYPLDFIERRTGMLYFDIETANEYLDDIVNHLAAAFHYSSAEKETLLHETKAILYQNALSELKKASL